MKKSTTTAAKPIKLFRFFPRRFSVSRMGSAGGPMALPAPDPTPPPHARVHTHPFLPAGDLLGGLHCLLVLSLRLLHGLPGQPFLSSLPLLFCLFFIR